MQHGLRQWLNPYPNVYSLAEVIGCGGVGHQREWDEPRLLFFVPVAIWDEAEDRIKLLGMGCLDSEVGGRMNNEGHKVGWADRTGRAFSEAG